MKRTATFMLCVFMLAAGVPAALSRDRNDRYNRHERYDSKEYAYRCGLEDGFREGLRHGRYDSRSRQRYDYRSRVYDRADGYRREATRHKGDYRKGFKNGYRRGYDEGYAARRNARRGWLW